MTSKLSVYVGAYFEIAVNLQEYPTGWLLCVNGHKHSDLCGRGTIIAAGNLGERDGGQWVRYIGDWNLSIAALPSYEDAARMAASLMSDYAAVYQALLASPAVSSVRVAVGIVPYLD